MNFTPAQVHERNNKSLLLAELKEMKRKTRDRRKEYWMKRSELARGLDLGDAQSVSGILCVKQVG
jgi:hypothetical protein